ncbi:MAG: hypothetical protein M1828_004626 [Chrysothrix sp. TS-e1954]|nr:MAG: hypothetical protein M1828_004626 [Chrysothrix sp. TS-e1954]
MLQHNTNAPSIRLNGEVVRDTIPGLRTSAAFLSSLSTNLRIDQTSPLPSPIPSPAILAAPVPSIDSDHSLRSLSPLAFTRHLSPSRLVHKRSARAKTFVEAYETDVSDPPLIYLTDDLSEREEAVRLVSASVAGQQYFAIRTLLCHPLNLSIFAILLFLSSHITRCWIQGSRQRIPGSTASHETQTTPFINLRPSALVLAVWSVVSIFAALLAYGATYAYKGIASRHISTDWLQPGDDIIVATSATDGRVIGAAVIGWTTCFREAGRNGGRKRRVSKAWIKAWTVEAASRNQDIGTSLLSEAVTLVKCRYGTEGCISFAKDHAHSERVLPAFYNAPFDRRDHRANWLLRCLVEENRDRRR